VAASKGAPPGPGRDEIAWALCGLVPGSQWKELTTNPAGVCACLRDLERKDSTVTFWLTLRTGGLTIYEAPTVVVDRLGNLGFVAETRRFPLAPINLDGTWSSGHAYSQRAGASVQEAEGALVVPIDISRLPSGTNYRVRVEGFVGQGKDRQRWMSEPRKFYFARPAGMPDDPRKW